MLAAVALLALVPGGVDAESDGARRRALVIGIDGLRGDVLHRAAWERGDVPALRGLMERGVHAACPRPEAESCARTHTGPRSDPSAVWATGPGWAAVVTGVDGPRHGVTDNGHAQLQAFARTSQITPSFFARARSAGRVTAAGGVGAFLTSRDGGGIDPGVLDYECGPGGDSPPVPVEATSSCNLDHRLALDLADPERDEKLVAWLLARIADPEIDVVMGVLDQVDEAGHRHGFGPREPYREALRRADAGVARLLAAVAERAAPGGEEWLVVVTSDHGGHLGRWLFWRIGRHDRVEPEDTAIPFALATYGRAATRGRLEPPVTQMDVHPTVLHWLGIEPAPGLDGRVQALP